MSTTDSRGALHAGIERISNEAAGVLSVLVVRQQEMVGLLSDASAGSREAYMLITAVAGALAQIDKAPRRTPMLCVSCPRPLRKGHYSFGVVVPEGNDPTQMLALAVCWRCATDLEGIKAHAINGLRRIWPNLKPIQVTHPTGGRA